MVLRTSVLEEIDFMEVLKCDAGEVWRRTFGQIVLKK